ncbi:MAG: hypothetical protein WCF84_19530 [Anaerolineae bacterium]
MSETSRRPAMVLRQQPDHDATIPAVPAIQRVETDMAPAPEHLPAPVSTGVDPFVIAERVYQLLRDEIEIERIRRGWE